VDEDAGWPGRPITTDRHLEAGLDALEAVKIGGGPV
jgi:hypothetical protein